MKYKVKKKKKKKSKTGEPISKALPAPALLVTRGSYPMFFSFFQVDFITKETQLAVRLYRYVRPQRVRFFSRFGHK